MEVFETQIVSAQTVCVHIHPACSPQEHEQMLYSAHLPWLLEPSVLELSYAQQDPGHWKQQEVWDPPPAAEDQLLDLGIAPVWLLLLVLLLLSRCNHIKRT
jgi:hypothetical protein